MKQVLTKTISLTNNRSCDPPGKTGRVKYQLIGCFLAIAVVTLAVGLALGVEPSRSPAPSGWIEVKDSASWVGTLRWRIALGMALILGTTGLVFGFLLRNIAEPLMKSDHAAERMADGHLGVTLPTTASNEIGRIGENINGLAVNFQEVLTLVWNQTDVAIARLRRSISRTPPHQAVELAPETIADLTSAQQDLETMRMMVRTFDLYDVAITPGNQLTAKEEIEPYY